MLVSHGLQSALSPVLVFSWPVRGLCPEVRPVLYQQDPVQTNLQELLDKLQHSVLERTEPVKPVPQQVQREGEHFGLTLDTQAFSPEELCVRQAGRRLRVSGKTEKKQEEQNGCSSYTLQEFRQDFDLPEDLNPEAVSCYLDPDGKLHIQVSEAPGVEEAERELTIERSQEENTPSTEEKPEDVDSDSC